MNLILELSVPKAWSKATLGDVRRDDTTTLDPANHSAERFELYSIPAHETGVPERVRGRVIGSAKKILRPNTVLLSKINPRINRVWVVGDSHGLRQIGSGEWIAFCPIDGVVPEFLAHYLRQDRLRSYLASNVSGVGGSLMRVRPSVVDPFPFALPPFREQQRIAECLDSYLTRLDDAVASLERVRAKLKAYRAAVFKAAVEGRLVSTEASLADAENRDYEPAEALLARIVKERRRRWEEAELARLRAAGKTPKDDNWKARYEQPVRPDTSTLPELPEGWCWATLEQLGVWSSGGTPARSRPDFYGGSIPWVKTGELGDRDISASEECITPAGLETSSAKVFPVGTLLVAMYGATIGMTGRLAVEAATNQACAALLPDDSNSAVIPYVQTFLISQRARLRQVGQGGAQPNISQTILKAWLIPLPPLAEQQRIVQDLARLVSVASTAGDQLDLDAKWVARLKHCVLKWAFEGKLVDQDPSDEPAETLLARVRAERTAVGPGKKKSRRQPRGAA